MVSQSDQYPYLTFPSLQIPFWLFTIDLKNDQPSPNLGHSGIVGHFSKLFI